MCETEIAILDNFTVCNYYQSVIIGSDWKDLENQYLIIQYDIAEKAFKRQNERQNKTDEQTADDLLWEAGQALESGSRAPEDFSDSDGEDQFSEPW